jgi:hydroxymethylglutaryl-CoA synthase
VIGSGFRMCGPRENVYTMAATAVLDLLDRYDVDPEAVGFLGFGTESSTDASAGAVIVKGLVNQALLESGRPALSRHCEVPEFKHACLGGIYALKAAVRYLATDGADRVAIVVCGDIAEYERGSSGEPTQGAGAVAMLVEPEARLLEVDLSGAAGSSDYRGVDFRKPIARYVGADGGELGRLPDFPVFNGKYSTTCYVEAVLSAAQTFFERQPGRASELLRSQRAVFLHRPYQRMAETGLAFMYLLALAVGDAEDQAELAYHAESAGVDLEALTAELAKPIDVYRLVDQGELSSEVFPNASQVVRSLRSSEVFQALSEAPGTDGMREVGNLYTGALPAWMAAGLEEAARGAEDLTGARVLAVGYGSGDAAEIIPMRVAAGWREAARQILFSAALEDPADVCVAEYEALHDRNDSALGDPDRYSSARTRFVVASIGRGENGHDDRGIEAYRIAGC